MFTELEFEKWSQDKYQTFCFVASRFARIRISRNVCPLAIPSTIWNVSPVHCFKAEYTDGINKDREATREHVHYDLLV